MSFTFDSISGLWFGDVSLATPGPTSGSALPATFTVRRAYEGPQIYIEYPAPVATGLIVAVYVVRRRFGYPSTFSDGTVIYAGGPTAQTLSDMDVVSGIDYFYKLFVQLTDGTVISSTNHQAEVIALETGFFAQKFWDLVPEEWRNADKRKDINSATKIALVQAPGETAEVFNLGEDGTVRKGQLQRLYKVFGPLFDEAKGLLDALLDQLDFDNSTLQNLTQLAQTLGLDLNLELTPEKTRNEARQQVDYLKLKGTKPGIIARMRAVSNAQPIITEQFNNVLYSNDPTRTSLQFIAAEASGISSPNDIIFRSVGYPDTAPYWLWFNVFMDSPDDVPLDEVTVRKWCIVMNESAPVCHKGFLFVTGTSTDSGVVSIDDFSLDDEAVEFVDDITVEFRNFQSDVATYDPTKVLMFSDLTKTFDAPNFGAVFPGIPSNYTTPETSG